MPPPVRPPTHLLHIGPWAAGVAWRAVPNKGLLPTVKYPAQPLLAIPDTTSMTFTLSRDDVSEATVEFYSGRGSAIIVEEMITDLWWRRRNHATGVTENIGRFQARDVQVNREGDQIRTSVQWQNYRGVLEDRMIYATDKDPGSTPPGIPYPAGTPVTTILRDILPVNSLVDLSALNATNLGTVAPGLALGMAMGDKIGEVISRLRTGSTLWDWDVELVGDAAVLTLYPGGRRSNHGVILVDKGSGYSPMKSWDRRTNGEDFASSVIATGQTGSKLAQIEWAEIPQGQRDYRHDDRTLASMDWIERAAKEELARRSKVTASWQVELMPGFWQGRTHIDLGDYVRLIVTLGDETLDEEVQVETISVEVPATGIEKVSLTLGLPRPNPDPRSKRSTTGKIINKIVNRLK